MRVFKSYSYGIKEATSWPNMIFLLWLINFIFGSFIFFIFYSRLAEALGQSAIAEGMLAKFDPDFLFEFLIYYGQSLVTIFSAALFLVCAYMLISIFLYGGVLHSLVQTQASSGDQRERSSFLQLFFQGGGKFFGRFFRLALYSLILWLVFLVVMFILSLTVIVLTDKGTKEQLTFYLFLAVIVIALFLIFLINMIQDYARIRMATEDARHVFRSLCQSIGFVFHRLGGTLGLYYLFVLTGVALLAVYRVLKAVIPFSALITIMITFLVYQLFIASHGWLKIAFQAGQLSYYTRAKK